MAGFWVGSISFSGMILVGALFTTGCITTHDEGFVNYKAMGDVYGTKPQAIDYEEVGTMKDDASGFFWTSCAKVCKEAVMSLKDKSKDRGGDSLIDLSYRGSDAQTKTPTCATHWSWAYLYVLPVFGPWVQTCEVEGVAVARNGAKSMHNQAQKSQGEGVQININNTQNNGPATAEPVKPAH
jgi:hypothetical protein